MSNRLTEMFLEVLDKHVLLKFKNIAENQPPLISKEFRKLLEKNLERGVNISNGLKLCNVLGILPTDPSKILSKQMKNHFKK